MRPRPGYRFFTCSGCGHDWRDECRDRLTPSGTDCPVCGEFERPHGSQEAPLPVDELGNLKEQP